MEYVLELLTKEWKKLERRFVKVEKLYERTDDIKYYYELEELNEKKFGISSAIELIEDNKFYY
tara:strand:+ start:2146 stop:2334 length:189 start_codon:yes stop_codon:yes gene_type:complete